MAITDELAQLRVETLAAIEAAQTTAALDEVRVAVVGKSGSLTGYLRNMGNVAKEERATVGKTVNEVRNAVEAALEERKAQLAAAELEASINASAIDITMPGRSQQIGTRHLINAHHRRDLRYLPGPWLHGCHRSRGRDRLVQLHGAECAG